MLTVRTREWIAWAVNVHLNLSPPLRERHVQAILEPSFDTDLPMLLSSWPAHLHPLIVKNVVRESRTAPWPATRSTDPPPPPLVRR